MALIRQRVERLRAIEGAMPRLRGSHAHRRAATIAPRHAREADFGTTDDVIMLPLPRASAKIVTRRRRRRYRIAASRHILMRLNATAPSIIAASLYLTGSFSDGREHRARPSQFSDD